jgi:hypothetical protein
MGMRPDPQQLLGAGADAAELDVDDDVILAGGRRRSDG